MFIQVFLTLFSFTTAKLCDLVNNACPQTCDLVLNTCVLSNCPTFTGKLGTTDSNPFSGTIAFKNNSMDLLITLSYTDSNYNDTTLYGISTGENDNSCLTQQLWIYTDSSFTTTSQSSYVITYGNDGTSNRYYQFTIPSADFVSKLQTSQDGTQLTLQGFYSFTFSIGTAVQSEVRFSFTAIINTQTSTQLSTTFGSISTTTTLSCQYNSSCTITPTSSIVFCQDQEACTNTSTTANLYLNDQIWIKVALTTSGTEGYYLTNNKIYYTGDKLYKPATIEKSILTNQGYALFLITINIAWSPVSISVTSTLSSTKPSSRFLNEEQRILTTYGSTTSAQSSDVTCVYESSNSTTCIKCDQTCDVDNSDSSPQSNGCPCSSNSMLLEVIMALTLLMILF